MGGEGQFCKCLATRMELSVWKDTYSRHTQSHQRAPLNISHLWRCGSTKILGSSFQLPACLVSRGHCSHLSQVWCGSWIRNAHGDSELLSNIPAIANYTDALCGEGGTLLWNEYQKTLVGSSHVHIRCICTQLSFSTAGKNFWCAGTYSV